MTLEKYDYLNYYNLNNSSERFNLTGHLQPHV